MRYGAVGYDTMRRPFCYSFLDDRVLVGRYIHTTNHNDFVRDARSLENSMIGCYLTTKHFTATLYRGWNLLNNSPSKFAPVPTPFPSSKITRNWVHKDVGKCHNKQICPEMQMIR